MEGNNLSGLLVELSTLIHYFSDDTLWFRKKGEGWTIKTVTEAGIQIKSGDGGPQCAWPDPKFAKANKVIKTVIKQVSPL